MHYYELSLIRSNRNDEYNYCRYVVDVSGPLAREMREEVTEWVQNPAVHYAEFGEEWLRVGIDLTGNDKPNPSWRMYDQDRAFIGFDVPEGVVHDRTETDILYEMPALQSSDEALDPPSKTNSVRLRYKRNADLHDGFAADAEDRMEDIEPTLTSTCVPGEPPGYLTTLTAEGGKSQSGGGACWSRSDIRPWIAMTNPSVVNAVNRTAYLAGFALGLLPTIFGGLFLWLRNRGGYHSA